MAIEKEAHIQRHKELHRMLDELLADFIERTGRMLTKTSLLEFLTWSFEQTINPTEEEEKQCKTK